MPSSIAAVTQFLSLGTIGAQAFIAFFLVALVFFWDKEIAAVKFLAKHAIPAAFFVALFTTVFSLFFSEIAGFEPCKLCWIQRIFLFPQTLIFGIAWWKKDIAHAVNYSIALSSIGLLVAGYQVLLQYGVAPNITCAAAAVSVSCSKIFFTDFGYITIPIMSATAFGLLLVFSLAAKRHKKSRDKKVL